MQSFKMAVGATLPVRHFTRTYHSTRMYHSMYATLPVLITLPYLPLYPYATLPVRHSTRTSQGQIQENIPADGYEALQQITSCQIVVQ